MAVLHRPIGRVLIIEDHDGIRETLVELLEAAGYGVDCAADGSEALRFLQTNSPPHLILLNLIMPVMDGWEFRRQQLQQPALAAIPVVLMSAVVDLTEEALALRAVDIVPKPVELRVLLDIVARRCP